MPTSLHAGMVAIDTQFIRGYWTCCWRICCPFLIAQDTQRLAPFIITSASSKPFTDSHSILGVKMGPHQYRAISLEDLDRDEENSLNKKLHGNSANT